MIIVISSEVSNKIAKKFSERNGKSNDILGKILLKPKKVIIKEQKQKRQKACRRPKCKTMSTMADINPTL